MRRLPCLCPRAFLGPRGPCRGRRTTPWTESLDWWKQELLLKYVLDQSVNGSWQSDRCHPNEDGEPRKSCWVKSCKVASGTSNSPPGEWRCYFEHQTHAPDKFRSRDDPCALPYTSHISTHTSGPSTTYIPTAAHTTQGILTLNPSHTQFRLRRRSEPFRLSVA